MNIHDILQDPAQLRALTTLDPAEFRNLVRPFDRAFVQRRKMYSITGKRRRLPASRVRLSKPTKVLPTREERLLFILLSLKTDAIQQHLALTFGLKQTTVSKWQRFLEPVLDKTLRRLGHRPARTLDELVAQLNARHHADERSGAPGDGDGGDGDGDDDDYGANRAAESLHIDATTRSVPRSGDAAAQRYDYSGKAHAHVVKNTVVCAADQRIVYLGPTWRGAMHDKRMADEELPRPACGGSPGAVAQYGLRLPRLPARRRAPARDPASATQSAVDGCAQGDEPVDRVGTHRGRTRYRRHQAPSESDAHAGPIGHAGGPTDAAGGKPT